MTIQSFATKSASDRAEHTGRLEAFAALGKLPASWADAAKRKELLSVVGTCAENARRMQAIRTELIARVSPVAFAPENAATVTRAAGYRSFFARLFPGWWSLKKQLR